MGPGRVLTFGLFEFSLAVVAVVAGAAQQLDFLLPFEVWDWLWREQIAGPGQWLAGLGVLAQLVGGVIAVGSLIFIGVVTGVVQLSFANGASGWSEPTRVCGAARSATRTDLVMPVHRVQALRLSTGLVRRWFGWHS